MEPRKQAILDALDAFVRQRSGMDFRNYGDVTSYLQTRARPRDRFALLSLREGSCKLHT